MNQNDLLIRRRLIQKMEFLAEDVASLQEPTNADLQGRLKAHLPDLGLVLVRAIPFPQSSAFSPQHSHSFLA